MEYSYPIKVEVGLCEGIRVKTVIEIDNVDFPIYITGIKSFTVLDGYADAIVMGKRYSPLRDGKTRQVIKLKGRVLNADSRIMV